MPRPVHFELPADNPDRAVKFYQSVFDWKIDRWEGPVDYFMVSTGSGERGIDGGIMQRQQPGSGTVNTIEVGSLDSFVDRVQKHGGSVVVPRMAVPGIGWLCYCMDTEQNMFGMLQSDPAAK